MSGTIRLPYVRQQKKEERSTVIRLSEEVHDAIEDLAYKTAMSKKQVADILLRDALARVELVERKVYEMSVRDEAEEE